MTGFNRILSLSTWVILSDFSSCVPWKHTRILIAHGELPYNCVNRCYGKRSMRLISYSKVLVSCEISTAWSKLSEVINALFFQPHAHPLGHRLCTEAQFIKVD